MVLQAVHRHLDIVKCCNRVTFIYSCPRTVCFPTWLYAHKPKSTTLTRSVDMLCSPCSQCHFLRHLVWCCLPQLRAPDSGTGKSMVEERYSHIPPHSHNAHNNMYTHDSICAHVIAHDMFVMPTIFHISNVHHSIMHMSFLLTRSQHILHIDYVLH